ncbi:MAG: 2-oxo-4-hydroxy-4-carboxy-5-ureidoimidazoline decarboxylase [Flavobacteriales bacterium]
MTFDQLNRLSETDATAAFTQCCACARWAERMEIGRPYEGLSEMLEISDRIWDECDVDDYLEAFQGHPRIGDVESLAKKYANTKGWAGNEQKGVDSADPTVIQRLADGNKSYEEKFGHIFIVCATGKTAAEMLALLEARMPNDPKTEVMVAAEEQNKITRIRLKKLLA